MAGVGLEAFESAHEVGLSDLHVADVDSSPVVDLELVHVP
jgi:hypothetical protein